MTEHADSNGEMGSTALENEVQSLRLKLKAAADENIAFRKALWQLHGHVGLYGDDGEMQCGECVKFGETDYKRAPAAEVIETATRVMQYLHGTWEDGHECASCGEAKPCASDGIVWSCRDCFPSVRVTL